HCKQASDARRHGSACEALQQQRGALRRRRLLGEQLVEPALRLAFEPDATPGCARLLRARCALFARALARLLLALGHWRPGRCSRSLDPSAASSRRTALTSAIWASEDAAGHGLV